MCLITKQKYPIKSRKRIKVYKILSNLRGNIWVTPYSRMDVPKNGILEPKELSCDIRPGAENNTVYGGLIHSCLTLKRAKQSTFGSRRIFRGYIPKGTLYMRGIDDDIAAKKVVLNMKPLKYKGEN